MPTDYVSLSVTRPAKVADTNILEVLRQAINSTKCVPIEISAVALIVECDAAALAVKSHDISRT
jgi:hypothetical protein